MDRDLKKKYTITLVVAILCLVVIVFSSSYAYFKARISGEGSSIDITGGTFNLIISESKINASGLAPIYDTQKSTKASKNDFTITLTGTGISKACYDLYLELDTIGSNLQNKYLKYELTSGSNTYSGTFEARTSGTRIALLKDVTITSSNSYTLRIWLSYDETVDQSSILTGEASTRSLTAHLRAVGTNGECKLPTLKEAILEDNIVSSRTSFNTTNTSNTTGIVYSTDKTEDGSTQYYYSGNTTNNWVKFGKYSTSDSSTNSLWSTNDDMYWRIIRTNEDGSVRLLYAGTSPSATNAYIGSSSFNSGYNESRYVGYMYGGNTSLADNRTNTTSSAIKGVIDTWYQNNLLTSYDKYISKSAIYCNDRSVGSGDWVNTGTTFDYGAYTRLYTNKSPSYKCGANATNGLFESTQAVADKFSASTTGGGNGQLTYPVALVTVDEIAFAGGVRGMSLVSPYAYYMTNSNSEVMFSSSNSWWTMTPARWWTNTGLVVYGSFVFGVSTSTGIYENYAPMSVLTRPVVSLSSCTQVTGTGTATDPYVIDTTSSTCS